MFPRLLSVAPATPTVGAKSLSYQYAGHHRRVLRTIQQYTASGWTPIDQTHFLYDGWNVIEEYRGTGASSVLVLSRALTWGQDLSGSLQGAGGVGGLLIAEECGTGVSPVDGSPIITTTAYHFHYDGNGNVTEITDATATNVASYRYDAYGNTLTATGSYATTNRYRFSTKPLDHEVTNAPLYYYGYRYYDPITGRWPSRDPIGERGGLNVYGMVGNGIVNYHDLFGLKIISGRIYVDVTCLGKEHLLKGYTYLAEEEYDSSGNKVLAKYYRNLPSPDFSVESDALYRPNGTAVKIPDNGTINILCACLDKIWKVREVHSLILNNLFKKEFTEWKEGEPAPKDWPGGDGNREKDHPENNPPYKNNPSKTPKEPLKPSPTTPQPMDGV